jgi:hypothetical protein
MGCLLESRKLELGKKKQNDEMLTPGRHGGVVGLVELL